MKRVMLSVSLAIAVLGFAEHALAYDHYFKTVTSVNPPSNTGGCFYFMLNGVASADPNIAAGNPWFAVPKTHQGYSETVAAVLAARLSGLTISVHTTGQLTSGTCGTYPAVDWVVIN